MYAHCSSSRVQSATWNTGQGSDHYFKLICTNNTQANNTGQQISKVFCICDEYVTNLFFLHL